MKSCINCGIETVRRVTRHVSHHSRVLGGDEAESDLSGASEALSSNSRLAAKAQDGSLWSPGNNEHFMEATLPMFCFESDKDCRRDVASIYAKDNADFAYISCWMTQSHY